MVDITEKSRSVAPWTELRTPVGERTLTVRTWARSDPDKFFTDNEEHHAVFEHYVSGYADHAGKYTLRRFGSLDAYATGQAKHLKRLP